MKIYKKKNPPLKQVVHKLMASFFATRTKAGRPTGMFTPFDQVFIPYRKLYMESQIIIKCVFIKCGVRGTGVKSKARASS